MFIGLSGPDRRRREAKIPGNPEKDKSNVPARSRLRIGWQGEEDAQGKDKAEDTGLTGPEKAILFDKVPTPKAGGVHGKEMKFNDRERLSLRKANISHGDAKDGHGHRHEGP